MKTICNSNKDLREVYNR